MSRDSQREALLRELSDLVRASQRATDTIDDLVAEILGTNRTDGRCLDILDQLGRLTAGQLAAEAGLSTGAITAVVDRLERFGYARRVADPADRRRVLIEATDKARTAGMELFGPLAEAVSPLLARYSDEQVELLVEFQRRALEISRGHADWLRAKLAEKTG